MNELNDITEINREIRTIVSAAENIGRTAANAMLVAKQADINAEGFNMVARELRMYSERMSAAMQGLSGLVDWQAEVNASKRRQADIDEVEQLITSQVRDLKATVKRAGKQCASGLMIARLASLEAAYEGAMTPVLRQIAQEVEVVIDNIAERVRKLESRLTEVGL